MEICGEDAVGFSAGASHAISEPLPGHEAPSSASGHGADLGMLDDPASFLGGGHSGSGEDILWPQGRKKAKKKRSGKKRPKSVDVAQFVRDTCNRLQEKKYSLVWAAVKKLGVDGVRNLVMEVDVVEKCGGQMTNDGKRRRTPGGVMWNILRGRVEPAVYKEIMSQGNEVQKQKAKEARESLKRNRMDVDAPVSSKRQKLDGEDVDMSAPMAGEKRQNQSHRWPRPAKNLLHVMEVPQRDVSFSPAVQMQKAWAEGIRKKLNVDEAAAAPVRSPGGITAAMPTCSVAPDCPGRSSVSLVERLRLQVQYSDLVKEAKSAPSSEREGPGQQLDLDKETLCEDGTNFEDSSRIA